MIHDCPCGGTVICHYSKLYRSWQRLNRYLCGISGHNNEVIVESWQEPSDLKWYRRTFNQCRDCGYKGFAKVSWLTIEDLL
jgi:hypothetical protein